MCQIGADAGAPPRLTAQWYFVRFHYQPTPHGTSCPRYPTTQLLQVKATSWIH